MLRGHLHTCNVIIILANQPLLKEFLKNAYQIYTFLIKLKLNKHIATDKQL